MEQHQTNIFIVISLLCIKLTSGLVCPTLSNCTCKTDPGLFSLECLNVTTLVNTTNGIEASFKCHNQILEGDSLFRLNLSRINKLKIRDCQLETNALNKLFEIVNITVDKDSILDLSYNSINNLAFSFQDVHELILDNLLSSNFSINSFENLRGLKMLSIKNSTITSLESGFFHGLDSVTKIDLSYNQLEDLPKYLFTKLTNLKELRLTHNKLNVLPDEVFLCIQGSKLTIIDFSYNEIATIELKIGNCIEMEEMYFGHNKISDLTEFNFHIYRNLRVADFHNNLLTNFWANDIPTAQHKIKFDFRNNKIKYFNLRVLEVSASQNANYHQVTILIENNPIECDCKSYDLALFFQRKMVKAYDLVEFIPKNMSCSSPSNLKNTLLSEVHISSLVCDVPNCPDGCECYDNYYNWEDKPEHLTLHINCSYRNLDVYPYIRNQDEYAQILYLQGNRFDTGPQAHLHYENVWALYLSHNLIKNITWIPPNLKILHLHNNQLRAINNAVIELLTKANLSNLTLHGNLWVCDCAAYNLTEFIRRHNSHIHSIDQIQCESNSTPLTKLFKADLCETPTLSVGQILLIVCVILLFIITLCFALYYRYQYYVAIWWYNHNLPPILCMKNYDEDRDMKYDIFISYSHKDEDFVNGQLLPNLENGSQQYKVCVHYRDWEPGRLITDNIQKAVEESKRTLVVLSNNFLESIWGKHEFRTAHARALRQDKTRVIVIIYGELNSDKLDTELDSYLKTNTYVKWGDPWFWSKLKYALPHYKNTRTVTPQRSKDIDEIMSKIDSLNDSNSRVSNNAGLQTDSVLLKELKPEDKP